ncbi:hypothetical protein TrRE_jg2038, partial [Triparma retinervis]
MTPISERSSSPQKSNPVTHPLLSASPRTLSQNLTHNSASNLPSSNKSPSYETPAIIHDYCMPCCTPPETSLHE